MGKKFLVFVVLCVASVGLLMAVNAPVQDVYNFDVRASLKAAGLDEVPDAVELIQAAIAMNIDPSVAIPNFGKRLSVEWDPATPITKLELAVMAVKLLGAEERALNLYPIMSPTFSDMQTELEQAGFAVKDYYYQRAFGYAELYENFLRKEYPCLAPLPEIDDSADELVAEVVETTADGYKVFGVTSKEADAADNALHEQYVSRLDVLEFIVRLAQAKHPELFGSLTVNEELKAVVGENPSLVEFSEKLSEHLRTLYGEMLPENVGFLYSFEFFFLTDKKVEIDDVMHNLAVPVLFLDTFRTYRNRATNALEVLGRYGDDRDFKYYKPGTNDVAKDADRWWTVALFAKIFATETEKVENGKRAPERILNNVLAYNPVDTFAGQVMFNDVALVSGELGSVVCETCEDPALGADAKDLEVAFLKLAGSDQYYVITDMTAWNNRAFNLSGADFSAQFCDGEDEADDPEGVCYTKKTEENFDVDLTFVAKATVKENGKPALDVDWVFIPEAQKEKYAPYKVTYGMDIEDIAAMVDSTYSLEVSEVAFNQIFIPNANGFLAQNENNILNKLVYHIVCGLNENLKDFPEYVNVGSLPVSSLVKGESVFMNWTVKLTEADDSEPSDIVDMLVAKDRLNHSDEDLTIAGLKKFVAMYDTVIDRIADDENSPMVSYYQKLIDYAAEHEIPDSAKLVSVVKTKVESKEYEMSASSFRMMEQILGQVRALEVMDSEAELMTVKGFDRVAPEGEGSNDPEYAVAGLREEVCGEEEDEEKVYSDPKFCIISDCTFDLDSWLVALDPYANYLFQFPNNAKVVKMAADMSVTKIGEKDLLQKNFLGFHGVAVNEYVIARSIQPVFDAATKMFSAPFETNQVILRAYEVE
ncbi:MAG TPA: hypothetical protein PLF96_05860 [Thermotogota bacterium]|nr:hypothetical protein [Thermotogota bacterium]